MKKLWLFIPAILLVAAGCNSASKTTTGTSQGSSLPRQTPAAINSVPTNTMRATATPTPQSSKTINPPAAASIIVTADDNVAVPANISATKGQKISITFKVGTKNANHGGIDFRSSVVNTGAITPGQSKTVTFTATQSFDITPYLPSNNAKGLYLIHVVVK